MFASVVDLDWEIWFDKPSVRYYISDCFIFRSGDGTLLLLSGSNGGVNLDFRKFSW